MKSRHPKVLQKLAGRPLLQHVLDTAAQLHARSAVVVTGHGAQTVEDAITVHQKNSIPANRAANHALALKFVRQEPQLGTGHAVQQAIPALTNDGIVIVLSGDVPLTQADTLRQLIHAAGTEHMALLTVNLPDPTGYGRIIRNQTGNVQRIVEHRDANEDERRITEIYSGIMAVSATRLAQWLGQLNNHNAQEEYYLTDIVGMAVRDGITVVAHTITDAIQVAGINSPQQLAELERAHQLRQAHALMNTGVRLADPGRFDLRDDTHGTPATLLCGQDVEIDVGCIFTGHVEIGDGASIGAYCHISNAVIEAGAIVHPYTHIDGEQSGVCIGAGTLVGPFARLRPGTQLGRNVHIGNFVEIKNSRLADGAKANHLAYLGDAEVGERVNYGAGSITANYDGANKHRTIIEADVHIGSNCVLVAPITIGTGGTVGGGSTVTQNTAAGTLTVVRGETRSIAQWKRPSKKPDA